MTDTDNVTKAANTAGDAEPAHRAPSSPEVVAGATHVNGSQGSKRVDGRVMRGLRNRQALIDAYCALAMEILEEPRAVDIAERAGVSVRSLFQHFRDLDDLKSAAVEEMCRRVVDMLLVEHDSIDITLPLEERLDRFLHSRTSLWELLQPLRKMHLLGDGLGETAAAQAAIEQVRNAARGHLRMAFGAELAAVPLDDEYALTALQLSMSSASWDHLRLVQGYDVETARAVMRHLSLAVLGGRERERERAASASPTSGTTRPRDV